VAEGDDSLSGANNIDLDVFLGSFKKLGLNVTADITNGLAGATFCQLRFDYDKENNLIVYKPLARTLMKLSFG